MAKFLFCGLINYLISNNQYNRFPMFPRRIAPQEISAQARLENIPPSAVSDYTPYGQSDHSPPSYEAALIRSPASYPAALFAVR